MKNRLHQQYYLDATFFTLVYSKMLEDHCYDLRNIQTLCSSFTCALNEASSASESPCQQYQITWRWEEV